MVAPTVRLIAAILSEVTKVIKSGDEQRIRDLYVRLLGKEKPGRSSQKVGKVQQELKLEDAESFANFETREQLEAHLEEAYPSKHEIAAVARVLKAPVTKADNYESLLNKIVDATVGYRLRSETIRGRPRG